MRRRGDILSPIIEYYDTVSLYWATLVAPLEQDQVKPSSDSVHTFMKKVRKSIRLIEFSEHESLFKDINCECDKCLFLPPLVEEEEAIGEIRQEDLDPLYGFNISKEELNSLNEGKDEVVQDPSVEVIHLRPRESLATGLDYVRINEIAFPYILQYDSPAEFAPHGQEVLDEIRSMKLGLITETAVMTAILAGVGYE
jgi:hypothetical protein